MSAKGIAYQNTHWDIQRNKLAWYNINESIKHSNAGNLMCPYQEYKWTRNRPKNIPRVEFKPSY